MKKSVRQAGENVRNGQRRTVERLLKAAWISLVLTAIALGLAKTNLFSLESRGGEISDDIAQRVGIETYAHRSGANSKQAGQDVVRVISIDEQGVDALSAMGWDGWPPGYQNLSIMLEDLMLRGGGKPRAIFLDFLITGRAGSTDEDKRQFAEFVGVVGQASGAAKSPMFREDPGHWRQTRGCHTDPLVKIACMAVWGATPVIIARSTQVGSPENAPQQDLNEVALLSPIQVHDRNYPLVRTKGEDVELYPAAALYAAHCMHLMLSGGDTCGIAPFNEAFEQAKRLKADSTSLAEVRPSQALAAMWEGHDVATLWSSKAAPEQARLLQQVGGERGLGCVSDGRAPWRTLSREALEAHTPCNASGS